jgi:hypothetical protein
MKTPLITIILAAFAFIGTSQGQTGMQGSIMLGGGYLEDPGRAYGFLQARGRFYEDDAFGHTFYLEYLGHVDDAVIEFPVFTRGGGGGTILEDGDILFSNITINYELEAKLSPNFSLFVGGGVGVELIDLDDRFNFTIDSDSNFVSQVFAGVRMDFGWMFGQAGVRYLMREDFSLLGDQFVTNDSAGFEIAVGFRF